jgi:hypothetical protein
MADDARPGEHYNSHRIGLHGRTTAMPLIGAPRRPEIDQSAIKFLIGTIALALPLVEYGLTGGSIQSISDSFWYTPGLWPRNIFVGFLFAISAFLLAYNGRSEPEMWLGKAASLAAAAIAMFPCGCGDAAREIIPRVHTLSATVMFGVLACFCYIFIRRARAKGHREALWRSYIYAACGLGMVVSIVLFMASTRPDHDVLVFWGEAVGLVSFGISWLTASRVLPGITRPSERERLVVFSR